MPDIKATVTTEVHVDEQMIEGVIYRDEREIVRWLIDTRDAQIRNALIELGWTPPCQLKK